MTGSADRLTPPDRRSWPRVRNTAQEGTKNTCHEGHSPDSSSGRGTPATWPQRRKELDTMGETWRPIPSWEGYYEVSDHGRIRSIDRIVSRVDTAGYRVRGRLLKLWANDAGYLYVMASRYGKKKRIWVHRAVLEAFVEPRPEGLVCMHLNNDPDDNRVANLRWGTHQENMSQCITDGRQANMRKTHCPRGHKLALPNLNAYILSQGRRACRACFKATQKYPLKKYGNKFVTEIANDNYARIMGVA